MKSSRESLDAWLRMAVRDALEDARSPNPPPESQSPEATQVPIILALLTAVAARQWGQASEMARHASLDVDDWALAAEFFELAARLPVLIRAERRHPGMEAHLREEMQALNEAMALHDGSRHKHESPEFEWLYRYCELSRLADERREELGEPEQRPTICSELATELERLHELTFSFEAHSMRRSAENCLLEILAEMVEITAVRGDQMKAAEACGRYMRAWRRAPSRLGIPDLSHDPPEWTLVQCRMIGKQVGHMHARGIFHGTLLFESFAWNAAVRNFGKAEHRPGLDVQEMAEDLRLLRPQMTDRQWAEFCKGYLESDATPGHPLALELAAVLCEGDAVADNPLLAIDFKMPHFIVRARGYALRNFEGLDLGSRLIEAQQQSDLCGRLEALTAFAGDYVELAPKVADEAVRLLISEFRRALNDDGANFLPRAIALALDALSGTLTRPQELVLQSLSFEAEALLANDPAAVATALSAAGLLLIRSRISGLGAQGVRLMVAAIEAAANPSQRGQIAVALMQPLLDRALTGAGSQELSQALRSLPPLDDIAVEHRPRIALYLELCSAVFDTDSVRVNERLAGARDAALHLPDPNELLALLDRLQDVPATGDWEDMWHPGLTEIMPRALRLFGRGEFYGVLQLLEPALQEAEEENACLEICLPLVGAIASALHQLADLEPEHRRQIAAGVATLLDRYTKKILQFTMDGPQQAIIGASAGSNLGLAAINLSESVPDPARSLEQATELLERAVVGCPRLLNPRSFSVYANNLSIVCRQRASCTSGPTAIEHLRRAESLLREVIEVDESFAGSSDPKERSLWEQRDIDELNLGMTAFDLARATDDATWISARPIESARWYRTAALAFGRASEAANGIRERARHGTAEGNLARLLLDISTHYVRHLRWSGGDVKREFYEWLCEFAGERVSTRTFRERCASRTLGAAMRSAQAGIAGNPSLMLEALALMVGLWSPAEMYHAVPPRLRLHILMTILETLESVQAKVAAHITGQEDLSDFRRFLEGVLRVELFSMGLADPADLSAAHAVFSRLTLSSSTVVRALARPRSRWLEVNASNEGSVTVNGLFLGRSPEGLEVRIPAQHRRLFFRGMQVKTCLPHIESLATLKGETARSIARMIPNLDWNDVPAELAVAEAHLGGCRVLAFRIPVSSWDVWVMRWLRQVEDEIEFEIDLQWIGVLDQKTNQIDPALPVAIDSGARCLVFGESGLSLEIALPPLVEGAGLVSAERAERGYRVRFAGPGILCALKTTPRIAGSDVTYIVKDDHPLAALCCAASFPLDLPSTAFAEHALRSFAPLFSFSTAPQSKVLEFINRSDVHEIVLVGLPDDADDRDAVLEALFDPRREIFLLVEEVELAAAVATIDRLKEHVGSQLGAALLGVASSASNVIEPFSGIQVIQCPRELAGAAAQMLLDLAVLRRRSIEGIPVIIDGRETYVEVVGNSVGPLRSATLLPVPSTWRDLAMLYVERRDQSFGDMTKRSELFPPEAARFWTPQVAKRPCVFLPEALTAVLACVPWVRHLGAIPLPRTENGRALATMLGQSDNGEEFPAEPVQIALRFQELVKLSNDRFLEKIVREASVFASSRALFQEMAPAEYLVLCTIGPDESAWGWLAANYAGALGAPLLPLAPDVIEGAAALIDAGSEIISGPGRAGTNLTRAFVLAERARRMPEMTTGALKTAIEAIEALRPRFIGFVSACTGFPLELVGSPPLATRFALGRLAGPDLLSTSLLIARAALSEDAARPAMLSVFLAEASDVPGQERLDGAALEVTDLAGMLQRDAALQVSCTDPTSADLEQFAAALTHRHLLHFAGHGLYDEHDPLASGLVFRGGLLAARDLPASLTGAPLIFGNACQSASLSAGDVASAHGWSGFAASIIAAGASNYVGSLWPVGDTSSQKIAFEFYQQLLQGEGVGEALRKARQACYQQTSGRDPTWAAFVLFGCPRNRFRRNGSGTVSN